MPTRKVNPYRVKVHRSYSVGELATCCHVHKNTVRHWQANGLDPVEPRKPYLFQGAEVRAFLVQRNASRKRPCSPGTLYCLRCRQPRPPALGMVDYLPLRRDSGNLRAICGHCETVMHRSIRRADIERKMPGCTVQITLGHPSLNGNPRRTPTCDSNMKG